MPPFLVDNSGACGSFPDHIALTEPEIRMVSDWVEAGSPAGNPADQPQSAPVAETPFTPNAHIAMPGAYTPDASAGNDDYHCFVIPTPNSVDQFLTGYRLNPGNSKIVHHAILFVPMSKQMSDYATVLDARDPSLGYKCFGSAGTAAVPAIAWAPGSGAVHYPAGTGVRLPAGQNLILQVHYSLAGHAGHDMSNGAAAHVAGTIDPDLTTIDLELASAVENEANVLLPGATSGVVIPAHQQRYPYTRSYPIVTGGEHRTQATMPGQPEPKNVAPFDLYGVLPHMHLYGKENRLEVRRAGADSNSCLSNVMNWNFNRQYFYFYKHPVSINDGDQLMVNCAYNTMSSDSPVKFGDFTTDEMCLTGMYVVWKR
jgi:hypothetical protein